MDRNHVLFRLKYPKFMLFLLTVLLAYYFYQGNTLEPLHSMTLSMGYFGTFIAGMLFTYGFTTAFAIALFLILAGTQNILLASLVGGFGALISDLVIFKFIRSSFVDEIQKLSHEKLVSYVDHHIPKKVKRYLLALVGGLILASPLPDEIGVALLAANAHVSPKVFSVLSYFFNTLGIFIIMSIGATL